MANQTKKNKVMTALINFFTNEKKDPVYAEEPQAQEDYTAVQPPRGRTITPESARKEAQVQKPRQTASRFDRPTPPEEERSGQRPAGYAQPRTQQQRSQSTSSRQQRTQLQQRQPRADEPTNAGRRRPAERETLIAAAADIKETKSLIRALIAGCTIIVTIDSSDPVTCMRILDTLSGAVYALGAEIHSASGSKSTYIITPRNALLRIMNELE